MGAGIDRADVSVVYSVAMGPPLPWTRRIPSYLLLLGLAALLVPGRAAEIPTVVVFGDSLTSGVGVDPDQAYPALLQDLVRAAGLPHRVVNAGVSGETTAGGLRRVSWVLRQPADVFVLALGGNDGLRGVPTDQTRENLAGIIRAVRATQPEARILLAGMEAPPNMGPEFTSAFRGVFPALAETFGLPRIPFLLEGVGGVPELNLADGIHPNPEGHRRMADLVWRHLRPLLQAADGAVESPEPPEDVR